MKLISHFKELPKDKLYRKIEPDSLPFETTDSCKKCDEIIGQKRALKAIQTGLDIKSRGYNIFITGMVGTGRTTTIKKFLDKIEKTKATPDDVLYVHNFKSPDEPTLIMLSAGKGKLFREDMNNLINVLKRDIPELLKSQFYTDKRNSIVESQQKKQKKILQQFEHEVSKEGFTVIQVQVGTFVKPDLVPVIDKKPTSFDKLAQLVKEHKFSKQEFNALKKKYEALTEKLEDVFAELKDIEEETHQKLKEWDQKSIIPVIKELVSKVRGKYKSTKIEKYLNQVEEDLTEHMDLFKSQKIQQREKLPMDPFVKYRVNLLVNNSDLEGAPIIMEKNPNYVNLFGSIESSMNRFGMLQTDFTKIKAGSLLKANGGYIVISALDALLEPGVWPSLKRTLKHQTLQIQNYASLYLFSAKGPKPEPIEINVKVIFIGDSFIYDLLYYQDVDFKKIFKIKAEFDSETKLSKKTIQDYSDFAKKIIEEDQLKPMDKYGMAALIEQCIRMAGRQKKVTTRFHHVADIIREANYWAKRSRAPMVSRKHIEKAVEERFERVSLIEDKIQEMIDEGTLMIDTTGSEVGQVNGLSVYRLGQFYFGKPTRITATTAVGRAGVINIEREADLSGRTHNKGVLILSGYLRNKYAKDKPFALSASLAFEQSYSGVDGDSASSTEAYALLSSLSNIPLRQDIAVTGSLNQKGEVQPIGAVNEKIEGFYDVCKSKRLTGKQGVIIPEANIKNLMLRRDLVNAVDKGKFHIYPVKTIDDGIEILTGIKAGRQKSDGSFEPDTVNDRVDKELKRLAKSWKQFSAPQKKEKNKKT
ncbi:MAG: AAA family ATPase [Candidatus Aminicenantes bacterium]|nr:AAA family ATPase [Candidatus Aminicenantes bacterium]